MIIPNTSSIFIMQNTEREGDKIRSEAYVLKTAKGEREKRLKALKEHKEIRIN